MKCLSVQQPWAHLILHGQKRIENRSWRTPYRGRLLIHAGLSRARLGDAGRHEPDHALLIFGAILGTVQLLDCVPVECAPATPFTEGPFCWLLADPQPLATPIPYRGRQLLFDVPDEFLRDPAGYLLFRNQ